MNSKEDGYTLIEIMVVLAIGSILVTGLFLINCSFLKVWWSNKVQAGLQQELRVSMNTIVNKLNSAVKIKKITDQKIILLNSKAEEKEIFYLKGQGLCLDSSQNKISSQVTELTFRRVKNNLLAIKLGIKRENLELTLKTAVKLTENQL